MRRKIVFQLASNRPDFVRLELDQAITVINGHLHLYKGSNADESGNLCAAPQRSMIERDDVSAFDVYPGKMEIHLVSGKDLTHFAAHPFDITLFITHVCNFFG